MGCDRPLYRHDGGPSKCIQGTRQDRCVPRVSKCTRTAKKGRRAVFLIVK